MRQKIKSFAIYFLIPILLFVLGAFNLFNYLKAGEFGITNLDVRELGSFQASRSGELLKGDIVSGTFRSKYSNLGIISLRFFNQNRDSKDTLVFRLREEGSSRWLYEAKYETDQFLPNKHFPFGFPIIKDSTDRAYEFELESLHGATGSGILLDFKAPFFLGKSSYQKAELLRDNNLLAYFITNKITNILGDPDILLNTILFFLPFLSYLVYILTNGLSYQYLTSATILFVFYDIFGIVKNYDFAFLSVLFFWGLISRRFRFESRIAAVFAMGFLIFTPIMLILKEDALAEKAAVWAYLFLCITVAQQVYELKRKTNKSLTMKKFFLNFPNFSISKDFWLNHMPASTLNAPYMAFVSSLGVFLIISPVITAFRVLPKYIAFFQESYLTQFIFTFVIPEIILVAVVVWIYIYFRKYIEKSKFILIIMLVMFNFVSGKIISKAISFENDPRIISVSPNPASEAWTDIVITGKNFRGLPFVGNMYIDDVEQGEYMVFWSDERIVFRTSPTITKSGNIIVTPLDRKSSNKIYFEFNYKQ